MHAVMAAVLHRRQPAGADGPLVLGALEPDQLVEGRRHFPRRRLGGATRGLMWGLRLYVVLMLVVVADRVAQALHG